MISKVGTCFTMPLLIFGIIFYFFFYQFKKKTSLECFHLCFSDYSQGKHFLLFIYQLYFLLYEFCNFQFLILEIMYVLNCIQSDSLEGLAAIMCELLFNFKMHSPVLSRNVSSSSQVVDIPMGIPESVRGNVNLCCCGMTY